MLTPSQVQVVELIAAGRTVTEITQDLGLTRSGVRATISAAKQNLGAASHEHLVAQALRQGLIR